MGAHWTCPFCQRDTTITAENIANDSFAFNNANKYDGLIAFRLFTITCPNEECREVTAEITLNKAYYPPNGGNLHYTMPPEKKWTLLPEANIKIFPDYIPEAILSDYQEACKIRDLSPKASATLSRRCLQGMIRDFWKIKKSRLVDEINALEGEIDPITWSAIDAVRSIGNIGAHMEKDVDLIIDVDPDEAQQLISLIETLLHEWYVVSHERKKRMEALTEIAKAKKEQKNGNATTANEQQDE